MASPTRPEPMNASPHHSKVKVALTLSDPIYVAGGFVTGKLELECRMDKGLGIGIVMVELFAIEELTSRDHSATSTFVHTRRLFQGPGLPPSNAVLAHPIPGSPPLPANYYHARKGLTTFMFRVPLPESSPSAISFGSGLARVRYEIRASVGVAYKGENRLVTDKKEVDVVESFEEDFNRHEPEGVIVGENGKIWVQAKLLGGFVVAGQPACVELQVKNHSTKKNSGLALSLSRNLHFPKLPAGQKPPFQISDTLTTVAFKGPEYVIPAGAEGVANLVFDTPRNARGVKGGPRSDADDEFTTREPLFEVLCMLSVKMCMGLGSKDITLDLPVTILHPFALPTLPQEPEYQYPVYDAPYQPVMSPPIVYSDRPTSPYGYLPPPMSPPIGPYMDQSNVWLPPDMINTHPYPYFSPPPPNQHYYYPPPPNTIIPFHNGAVGLPVRPSSTEPLPSQPLYSVPTGLPSAMDSTLPLLSHPSGDEQHVYNNLPHAHDVNAEPEEGKGERASRISHHLRMSSRARSASPPQHRFPPPIHPVSYQPTDSSPSQPIPIPSSTVKKKPSMNLTTKQLPGNDGAYHSPRPILSPKTSFSVDPLTHTVANKSENVEVLERLAEQVDKQNGDVLAGVLNSPPTAGIEKTLPAPPVPSGKAIKGGIGASLGRRRLEDVFNQASDPIPITNGDTSRLKEKERTPPTPTLTAVTPLRFSRSRGELAGLALSPNSGSGLSVPGGALSGLDALEAKLVAEVGTKKVDKEDKRADVRSVLAIPIDIPISRARRASAEDLTEQGGNDGLRSAGLADDINNDSAISSLTLAGEERAMMAARDTGGGTTLRPTSRSRSRTRTVGRGGDEVPEVPVMRDMGRERKTSSNKKEESSEKHEKREGRKMRKAVRGRVAAWLGSIEPDIPPPPVPTPPLESPSPGIDVTFDLPIAAESSPISASPKLPENPLNQIEDEDVATAPNPRSSGFVPIGTLKARAEESVDGNITPRPGHAQLPWLRNAESKSPDPPFFKFGRNLAADAALKYDIKSARGGKGGKVTAVAAIWASASSPTVGQAPKAHPLKPIANNPPPRRLDFSNVKAAQGMTSPPSTSSSEVDDKAKAPPKAAGDHKRPRMAKSTSVPAMISSSLAIPMLSTTASLSRPGELSPGRERPGKIGRSFGAIPTIQEDGGDGPNPASKGPNKVATAHAELAFGQARLRDLIKKYQGVGPR